MRPITLCTVLLTLVCVSSCVSYQYITLDSREVTKDTAKRLSWESDTLRLVYDISGYGGPAGFVITNKTDKPMYVNWKPSAIMHGDGTARSLFQSNVQMTGAFDARRGYVTTSGSLAGSFNLPEGMDFIPPGSSIKKVLSTVVAGAVSPQQLKGTPKTLHSARSFAGSARYQLYTFDQTASPLQFKSYLTFTLDSENAREFAVSHSFFARDVMLTARAPGYFSEYNYSGAMLYLTGTKR